MILLPATMRTTLNLDEDAALAARNLAQCQGMSLGKAVSELVRRGARVGDLPSLSPGAQPTRGRFALLPPRDEVITLRHVRELIEPEGS